MKVRGQSGMIESLLKFQSLNKMEDIHNDKVEREDENKMEKKKQTKKTNPWLVHVKKVKEENKDMKFKDILVKAKKSYKKC